MRTLLLSTVAGMALLHLTGCGTSSTPQPDPYDTVTRTDEFVSAKVDGQYYDCTAKFTFQGANDTLYNSYHNYPTVTGRQLRQINIFRMENSSSYCRRFGINLLDLDLDAAALPLELTRANLPTIASLDFGDYTATQGQVSGNDPNRYLGSTSDDLRVKLLSKSGDVLVGTFRGTVKNGLNQTKTITEGQFRIRLLRKTRP